MKKNVKSGYEYLKKYNYIIIGLFFLTLQLLVILGSYDAKRYDTFFWFCNNALFFFALGFFTKNYSLIKGLINVGFLGQLVWTIDFLGKIIFDVFIFNVTNYIFNSPSNVWTLLTITIHMFATSLALYVTRNIKPTSKTLIYSVAYMMILYIGVIIYTLPSNNVNWVFKIGGEIAYSSSMYTLFWPVIVFLIVILPTQFIQNLVYKMSRKEK